MSTKNQNKTKQSKTAKESTQIESSYTVDFSRIKVSELPPKGLKGVFYGTRYAARNYFATQLEGARLKDTNRLVVYGNIPVIRHQASDIVVDGEGNLSLRGKQ